MEISCLPPNRVPFRNRYSDFWMLADDLTSLSSPVRHPHDTVCQFTAERHWQTDSSSRWGAGGVPCGGGVPPCSASVIILISCLSLSAVCHIRMKRCGTSSRTAWGGFFLKGRLLPPLDVDSWHSQSVSQSVPNSRNASAICWRSLTPPLKRTTSLRVKCFTRFKHRFTMCQSFELYQIPAGISVDDWKNFRWWMVVVGYSTALHRTNIICFKLCSDDKIRLLFTGRHFWSLLCWRSERWVLKHHLFPNFATP